MLTAALYMKTGVGTMIICDTHCDTLYMRALEPGKIPCVTMENMVRGGMNLQTCTLFA